ncbi:MAG: PrpR N-terminal domain-containing protein [Oscillospiraceae bacterium]|jgi:transcriptional regulator with PAS, ATPase and Fis domain|nr:PrpR N-terminal domain-containing protein [Oscillospiraceae bacterium]
MIKMLVIAPYDGLKELIQSLSSQYQQFDIHTAVANLDDGVKVAERGEQEGYQLILSRGGTAELIECCVSIPVIRIDISGYDYIRMITLANGFSGKAAMIGYHSITKGAQSIKELMNSSIDIFTIDSSEKLPGLLERLHQENYRVIVGDVITLEKARAMGFTAILLTSGEESVRKALEDAQRTYQYIKEYRSNQLILEQMLNTIPSYFAVFDKDKKAIYQKLPDNAEIKEKLLNELQTYCQNVKSHQSYQTSTQLGSTFWKICAQRIDNPEGHQYIFFYILQTLQKKMPPPGLSLAHFGNASDFSISNFGKDSIYLKETYQKAQKFVKLHLPILITGEIGTGKDALAHLIHLLRKQSSSFLTLDGEVADKTGVEDFIQIIDDDPNSTLYLRRPNLLDSDSKKKLSAFLGTVNFTDQHQIITSLCESPDLLLANSSLPENFLKLFGRYRIHLPSLRDRPNDMKDLANNYLNEANVQYGKQVVAIEESALQLLSDFSWASNLDQLHRVISQLVLLTDNPIIRRKNVIRVLKEEIACTSPISAPISAKNKTLEEIVQDIIDHVMQEENGNITRVSSRLGVSRSTIWRKLKQKN